MIDILVNLTLAQLVPFLSQMNPLQTLISYRFLYDPF